MGKVFIALFVLIVAVNFGFMFKDLIANFIQSLKPKLVKCFAPCKKRLDARKARLARKRNIAECDRIRTE